MDSRGNKLCRDGLLAAGGEGVRERGVQKLGSRGAVVWLVGEVGRGGRWDEKEFWTRHIVTSPFLLCVCV